MSKPMTEETQQFLTVAFGGAVLVLGLLAYNNNPDTEPATTTGGRIMAVIRGGLPFLLVAYTLLVLMRFKGKAYDMGRNVAILVSLVALLHALIVNSVGSGGSKWEQVSHDVTTPLSAGAFVALPILFF